MKLFRRAIVLAILCLFIGAGSIPNANETYSFDLDMVYIDDDYNASTSGWGYSHFDNIQDGIDAIDENGTVFVYEGVYNESLLVNKTINITGINKINTIIDGAGYTDVIYITADNINISGFTIKNGSPSGNYSGTGIHLRANYTNISNNIIDSNNIHGIFIASYINNTIFGNTISNNQNGIYIYDSRNHKIINNNIIYNSDSGIHLHQSIENIIMGNSISQNEDAGGIYLGAQSNNNTIINNDIINNEFGINSIFTFNNTIYHNNILSNNQNAYDDQSNFWDDGNEGNFWSDYTGSDSDGDGIGETAYSIQGGDAQDHYPFVDETGWLQIPIANFDYTPQYPGANESVTFNASKSYDNDGNIVLYEWDFNEDGLYEKTGITVLNFWSISGLYSVTLKITDDEGLTNTKTRSIYVEPPALNIESIKGGFLRITIEISNTWDMTVKDISCYVEIKGGILGNIDIMKSYAILTLGSYDKIQVITNTPIFAFGYIDIKVTVDAFNARKTTEQAEGFLFGPFVNIT